MSMKITGVRVYESKEESNLKAFASVTIDDDFVVSGFRIVEGSKGLFVSMPQNKTKDGDWIDTSFPLSKETREYVCDKVMDAYNKELSNKKSGRRK